VSFRYYVYISDSKVDMLLDQIDPALTRKRTSELSVNLKVFSARRSAESPTGANQTARLERVLRYLHDHGDLRSVDEPGQFFWGLLPMQWGRQMSLVYFGGQTDQTIVALGGSTRHLVGSLGTSPGPVMPTSLLPSILAELDDTRGEAEAVDRGHTDADAAAFHRIQFANQSLRGPAQNVEFVAKRLLHGPSPDRDGRSVLIGTPLYVAQVD
jgi:hypothetical protein